MPWTTSTRLADGRRDAGRARLRVTLAGGNITRSPGPLVVDVTVVGTVQPAQVADPRRRPARGRRLRQRLARRGRRGPRLARAPDSARPERAPEDPDLADCVDALSPAGPAGPAGRAARPKPGGERVHGPERRPGRRRRARSREASGIGAAIDADAPADRPGGARAWFDGARAATRSIAAIAGGDDYELLFAVPPQARAGALDAVSRQARGLPLTRIGELTREPERGSDA